MGLWAGLQKVLDHPPNLDFNLRLSTLQSFLRIREKSLHISRKALIDLSVIEQDFFMGGSHIQF